MPGTMPMRPASGSTAKPGWLHAITNGSLTLKFLHPKRGTDAIKSIGINPGYTGVLIHDRWAADFEYFQCKHQVCRSHLLPDLTFVFESIGYRWARLVHKLLCEICHKVNKSETATYPDPPVPHLRQRDRRQTGD